MLKQNSTDAICIEYNVNCWPGNRSCIRPGIEGSPNAETGVGVGVGDEKEEKKQG